MRPPRYLLSVAEEQIASQFPGRKASDVMDALIAHTGGQKDPSLPAELESLVYLVTPYARRHGGAADTVILWPEDFISFFLDVAAEAGIDLREFGTKLDRTSKHPEYVPGIAFRTVAEIAGVYVEHPNALTEFRVPRSFLVVMAAAVIGVATGKAASLDPTIAGAVGGIGALLLNVLAQRYLQGHDPETDWLEEFVLTTLEQYGRQSADTLHHLTHIHKPLLKKTLDDLLTKNLVEIHRTWSGGRKTFYEVRR